MFINLKAKLLPMLINQIFLLGLIMDCPFDKPLSNCPLNKYRNKSFLDVVNGINKLNSDEILKLCCYHYVCSYFRERGNLEAI